MIRRGVRLGYYRRDDPCIAQLVDDIKVCRYNWHSAGSLGYSFPMLKYKYIFQIKYTEGSNFIKQTRKLLLFGITKMLIAV